LAEFDAYAANYHSLVSDNIRITGESSDYFAAYKAKYIARSIALRTGSKILDYGCGVGLLSEHLMDALPGCRIDGFDVSKESVELVSHSLRRQGIFTSDPEVLNDKYDLVVLSNVLHHVTPGDRQELIGKVASRLVPDGKLVIFEHNPVNPLTQWAVSQCAFDQDAVLLPNRETRAYFHRNGLRVVWRHFIVFFPRWLGWLRWFEPSLRWCPLGAQYVVVGRKSIT
jgi:2-polyprenyl-3-methyl-5-hydroxy-6-metoxy-1,4-benzoquinol methylase